MAAIFHLTTGVVYVRGWTGSISAGTTLASDGTAAAPSWSFASATGRGLFKTTNGVGFGDSGGTTGVEIVSGSSGAINMSSGSYAGWTSGAATGTVDLTLYRDAANTLAQRNGTNAQTFRVYSSWTDASNYSTIQLSASDVNSQPTFKTIKAGSGTAKDFYIGTGDSGDFWLITGNAAKWKVGGSTGHLLAVNDNTYDIGASGATRPRSGYFGGSLTVGGSFSHTTLGALLFSSDGVFRLSNNAGTDFSRLQFGGTTSSFPALKRVGTDLRVRVGDDSADGGLIADYLQSTSRIIINSVAISNTAPSVPVACTSPTVTWSNGTATFQIDVGTSCTGVTTLAFTMPAATNGYLCSAVNLTTANRTVVQTAGTTTSVTLSHFLRTNGAAQDWADGADIRVACLAG